MKPTTLAIRFGAMAPTLRAQLLEQKVIGIPYSVLTTFQHDADALTRLSIRGLLPARTVSAARQRLIKRICKQIKR